MTWRRRWTPSRRPGRPSTGSPTATGPGTSSRSPGPRPRRPGSGGSPSRSRPCGRGAPADHLSRSAVTERGRAGQNLLDPAVTKGVFDRLRKGKHLLKDEKLARLSPKEERILAKLEVARRAEAAAYLARHTTIPYLA